ncbi:hypothetical protein NADFUDRAFT_82701 [Nadsonia fulvescens var. elongata DSM 6958]|uniref:GOLD domain-containing protein n=1 Tax=Nadsonia fulvescens var. elongata DSM 6958 TaxID=857566 RepID=A0A1E3PK89_9ASCO|nr:hypothetical protein NADFUDRAFT_82701 [Nadsonia fulvescens var. elongata DSM 6958]
MLQRQVFAWILPVLALCIGVSATTLTTRLSGNEISCYYTQVDSLKTKLKFFFAVNAGGDYMIHSRVRSPGGKIMVDNKFKQADYVFQPETTGEYEFCFDNSLSTWDDKLIDFEISVENDLRAELPGSSKDIETKTIEKHLESLDNKVGLVTTSMRYLKTREFRSMNTVRSTENRIFYFSLIEMILMISISALQVIIVQLFFKGSRASFV